jgi:hypothetical protein
MTRPPAPAVNQGTSFVHNSGLIEQIVAVYLLCCTRHSRRFDRGKTRWL